MTPTDKAALLAACKRVLASFLAPDVNDEGDVVEIARALKSLLTADLGKEVEEIEKFLANEGDNADDEWAMYAGKLEDCCRTLLRILRLRGTGPMPHPNADYLCATCGAQWFEGIQQDCGHRKNELAYFKPSPCRAVLNEQPSQRSEQ